MKLCTTNVNCDLDRTGSNSGIARTAGRAGSTMTGSEGLQSCCSKGVGDIVSFGISASFTGICRGTTGDVTTTRALLGNVPRDSRGHLGKMLRRTCSRGAQTTIFVSARGANTRLATVGSRLVGLVSRKVLSRRAIRTCRGFSCRVGGTRLFVGGLCNPRIHSVTTRGCMLPTGVAGRAIVCRVSECVLVRRVRVGVNSNGLSLIRDRLTRLGELREHSTRVGRTNGGLCPNECHRLPNFRTILTTVGRRVVGRCRTLGPRRRRPRRRRIRRRRNDARRISPTIGARLRTPSRVGSPRTNAVRANRARTRASRARTIPRSRRRLWIVG